jgi:hypothetical protein
MPDPALRLGSGIAAVFSGTAQICMIEPGSGDSLVAPPMLKRLVSRTHTQDA